MRYAPAERLLRLALHLAGTRTGLTLDEMAATLDVGRRTAERLRDALMAAFPAMDCWDDEERVRRWRLPGSALIGVAAPKAEAVAAIEVAARECEARGETDRAALLRDASTTLRAVMRPDALRQAEPDIAALMEAEGIATRPGPRQVIAAGILRTLRRAILGMQLVVVRYGRDGADEPTTRILCPYGLLYGGRGWLIAHVDQLPDLRLWRLDRIVSADLLDRGFQRKEDFSLSAYAAQSFGVFQEPPADVVLRFDAAAAPGAATWLFHSLQRLEHHADGTLTVRFRAGGMQEICWHLFTWGSSVTIIAPDTLRTAMIEMVATVAGHHRQTDDVEDGRLNERWYGAVIPVQHWHFHRRLLERYRLVLQPGDFSDIRAAIREQRAELIEKRNGNTAIYLVRVRNSRKRVFVLATGLRLVTALPSSKRLNELRRKVRIEIGSAAPAANGDAPNAISTPTPIPNCHYLTPPEDV